MSHAPDSSRGSPRRHDLERLDLDGAAAIPQDKGWSKKIEALGLTQHFWTDPEPDCGGLLSADRIRAYHYSVGRMIRPFQEAYLNPASYDLTLGPRYVLDGEEAVFDEKRRMLRIPPSSIAMVTSREVLLMPHWLVATFNLKSKYIFDGLLMGAGPQIDPGYMGVLTCPLHNISSKSIELEFCQPFAKLDFVKTTWGKSVDVSGIGREDELYEQASTNELTGKGNEPVQLWDRSKNFRPPVSHLAGSEGARSSLRGLEGSFGDLRAEFESVERRVRTGQYFGAGFALAVISTLIALAGFAVLYTNTKVNDVRKENHASQVKKAVLPPSARAASRR